MKAFLVSVIDHSGLSQIVVKDVHSPVEALSLAMTQADTIVKRVCDATNIEIVRVPYEIEHPAIICRIDANPKRN